MDNVEIISKIKSSFGGSSFSAEEVLSLMTAAREEERREGAAQIEALEKRVKELEGEIARQDKYIIKHIKDNE